jgi:hypothetical protein
MSELGKTSAALYEIFMKDSALFEIYVDKHSELFKERYKMLDKNYDENIEKFNRGEKYHFNDEYFELKEKYAVEVALLEIKMKEINSISSKYEKRAFNLTATFMNDNSKKKKINNKEKKILEKEVCGICCEKHTIRHIITTSCNHHFGKKCLSRYFDYNFDKYLEIVCPICRNDDLTNFNKYK